MTHAIAEREAIFQRGIEAYRAGHHYEAHEIWEDLWHQEENDEHRRFLQALIQVTSAVHKMQFNVAARGSLSLLSRALQKLEPLPDNYGGIDIKTLRIGIERAHEQFQRILSAGPGNETVFSPGMIPPLLRTGDSIAWQSRPKPIPPDPTQALRNGLVAYRAGRFYEAHAAWEELRLHEPEGQMRTFLHGLIFLASAMHKLFSMNSPGGALKMLGMAEDRIGGAPDGICGISVGKLIADIGKAKESIQRMISENIIEAPAGMVPKIERMDH